MTRPAALLRILTLALLFAALAFAQAPSITSLSPSSIGAGSSSFTLRVFGTGFASPLEGYWAGAVVSWRRGFGPEIDLPTSYISDTEVRATVAADLIGVIGTASVRVTNYTGVTPSPSNSVAFQIISPVIITTDQDLPGADVGAAYSTALNATGGTPPYVWALVEGGLPPGTSLDSSSGVISGVPSEPGTYSFQIDAYDTKQSSDSKLFRLRVRDAPLAILTESELPNALLNEFYTTSVQASGGRPPYTWRVTGGAIPPGLTFFADGIMNGRPTQAGVFIFTLTVEDQMKTTVSREFSLWVVGPLSITTVSPLTGGVEGTPYSQMLEATGGLPPYTWSLAEGLLPDGLTLNMDGTVTGTPTETGTFNFLAVVTDQRETTARKALQITVGASVPPVEIVTPANLPDGIIGSDYNTILTARNGEEPYTWSVEQSMLPPGLSLNSGSGVLSGTPTETGAYSFLVTVYDANENAAERTFKIRVRPPQLMITTASPLPNGMVNQAYSATFAATGGTSPYTWTLRGGNLPPGMSLARTTGVLSGTPTSDGVFNFTIRVWDATEASADKDFRLTVDRATLTITTEAILPQGTVGQPYSQTFEATGGTPPYTWSRTVGDLPPGMSLSSDGQMNGTPTAGGDFGFRLRATDAAGLTTDKDFAIRITGPDLPAIIVGGLPVDTEPATPQALQVTISAAYPVDLTGTAALTFTPNATAPADDPAVQFESGGRSVEFTIPAGSTTASFGDAESIGVQTGSVAGAIRVSVVIDPGGGQTPITDTHDMNVLRRAASISSVTATRSGNSLRVVVVGMSSPRDMTRARFRLAQRAGTNLQTQEITVQLGDAFGDWYQGAESAQFGSTFRYEQPFTITGDATAVASVTVLLVNSSGDSQEVTGTVQ